MSEKQDRAEMEGLLALAPFRKFLFRSIQHAELLGYSRPATNGPDGRNLFNEGRRALGLDILHDAARGIPVDDAEAALNLLLITVLREGIQPTSEEKPNGRRDRNEPDDNAED